MRESIVESHQKYCVFASLYGLINSEKEFLNNQSAPFDCDVILLEREHLA